MEVTNIKRDANTGALCMCFEPQTPEGVAWTACIEAFIIAFPDDPRKVGRYSIAVGKMMGYDVLGPVGQQMTADNLAAVTAEMKDDPEAMAALQTAAPEVAAQVTAA